ncbi:Mam1p KNAG_0C03500 [Huiozyma naganishii CBS 8797]|uniref:Uncharacterized protein n=1 Tax=Huiozyma naganishii (strain ATCC MYA-139 / BCRC 22969 / CBS 8797 / KCTC 17520 / NBRC 10181 / NCYC 3082 / Yp74L-3) TaxID=1071383 RepID=J7R3Q1_HUIN7|nr:hypothetical protein KNAG_0C03500 [Kazachstania naganishii CBS 8797]CCK69455.1 hypothetical protein KNAG_0C03500 [Kazachstania naganishii CBS 8797]
MGNVRNSKRPLAAKDANAKVHRNSARESRGEKTRGAKLVKQRRRLTMKNSLSLSAYAQPDLHVVDPRSIKLPDLSSELRGDVAEQPLSQVTDATEEELLRNLQQISINKSRSVNESRLGLKEDKCAALVQSNLKVLQKQISVREIAPATCSHYFCSHENQKTVDFSRLWFLFELEMTNDAKINLRNDCYHERVYKAIDETWTKSNTLLQKVPEGSNAMPLSHLLLPNAVLPVKVPKLQQSHKSLSEISVELESVIEDESRPCSKTGKRMPTSSLAARYRKEVFGTVPINIKKILNGQSSSSPSSPSSIIRQGSSHIDIEGKNNIIKGTKLSYFR